MPMKIPLSILVVALMISCNCKSKYPVKNYGVNDNNQLFAFVGEKISVEPLVAQQEYIDRGIKAKYKILKKVYGDFPGDEIEFIAFDHLGIFAFANYQHVLLCVSADSGTYFHYSYLYDNVYMTKDGRWAGPYAQGDYEDPYNKHTPISPIKIDFAQGITLPEKIFDAEGRELIPSYPAPYYKKVGNRSIPVYGNYVEELFALKKTGVLTHRGIFKATAAQEEDLVESNQPPQPRPKITADDIKFMSFWKNFAASLKGPGYNAFMKFALDSLFVCDNKISSEAFVNKCFREVIDDEVQKRIIDSTKLESFCTEIGLADLHISSARKTIRRVGDGYRLRGMAITRSTKNNNPPTIQFDFIETKEGYRLYSIDHHWFKQCCQF